MNRSTIAVAAVLLGAFGTSAHAFRVMEDVETSVEIALRDVTLPADANGTLSFRSCATCPIQTHSLSYETVYRFNGRALSFEEFAAAVGDLRETPSVESRALAGVFLDLNTERVTRVIVHVGGAQ
jgi:hypothetical protein